MSAHSKIGASSMHRWAVCPASVRLSEGIKNTQSKYAEEGTAAHELAAKVILGKGLWPETRGLDSEMIDAVTVYTDVIAEELKDEDSKIWVEEKLDLSSLYPGLFGTADSVIYKRKQKKLIIVDYKHGAGIPVDVVDKETGKPNVQLLYYALGALYSSSTKGLLIENVELVIVQPRCLHAEGPIRKTTFPSSDLIDFSADLIEAAKRTEDPNAPLVPGEHCRFCPAAGKCPKLHTQALSLAKQDFKDVAVLPQLLEWLPVLTNWISSVREFAYAEAIQGRTPQGYKLVNKKTSRHWRSPDDLPSELFKAFGLFEEDVFSKAIKSPAQIEKLLKGDDKKLLSELIVSVSSGYTLAHESDKRKAVALDAKSEFLPYESNEGEVYE